MIWPQKQLRAPKTVLMKFKVHMGINLVIKFHSNNMLYCSNFSFLKIWGRFWRRNGWTQGFYSWLKNKTNTSLIQSYARLRYHYTQTRLPSQVTTLFRLHRLHLAWRILQDMVVINLPYYKVSGFMNPFAPTVVDVDLGKGYGISIISYIKIVSRLPSYQSIDFSVISEFCRSQISASLLTKSWSIINHH